MVSCVVMQTSGADSVFILVLHHLIADGWSIGIILSELMAAYGPATGKKMKIR